MLNPLDKHEMKNVSFQHPFKVPLGGCHLAKKWEREWGTFVSDMLRHEYFKGSSLTVLK